MILQQLRVILPAGAALFWALAKLRPPRAEPEPEAASRVSVRSRLASQCRLAMGLTPAPELGAAAPPAGAGLQATTVPPAAQHSQLYPFVTPC